MDLKLLEGTRGPLTNYLRSSRVKKTLNKDIMSSKLPRISVVNGDDDHNTVTVRNPINLDKIDIMSDSGSSAKSIPRKEVPSKPNKPVRSVPQMPISKNDIDPRELEYFINSQKHKPVVERKETYEESEESEQDLKPDYEEEDYEESENESIVSKQNSKELEKRKRELLIKLLALENKGVELTKKFSLKSRYEDIEFEYETQKKSLETEAGVKFQQKALMAFVTGLEFLNNKFDPVGAKLDGWSESVMDSIGDYDAVFRKLYEKYSTRSELPPELELLMTLVASGFMFHLTNSFFKTSMPAMGDILKSNPDIMANIASAMSKQPNNTQSTPRKEMSGPSLDLSSILNNSGFNKIGPSPPENTSREKEIDRFSVASSSDSVPISTISKSGKKTINIS